MVWHQKSGPRWCEEFEWVRGPRDWSIGRREVFVLVAGIVLLAIENFREAALVITAA
jgi:hypothetical protein